MSEKDGVSEVIENMDSYEKETGYPYDFSQDEIDGDVYLDPEDLQIKKIDEEG